MKELGFMESIIEEFCEVFVGTKHTIYDLYLDENGEEYATVDICCEIPTRCLELC